MRRLLVLGLLLLGLALAQKSGGGAGGRPYAPSPPPMAPGPAPAYPMPAPPLPYPGPVVVHPRGGGGSLGVLPVLVFLGLVLVGVFMAQGLKRAEGGPGARVARLRLALLVRPEVQRALRALAESADTTTAKGLADLLDEAALLLLKEEPAWRFAEYRQVEGGEEEVLGLFDAWMLEDRGAYRETFRHFEGKKALDPAYAPKVEPGGRYLVASLLLAERRPLPPKPQAPLDRPTVRALLLAFAASTPFTLMAAHLAWTPEKEEEGLTEEELLLFPGMEKV